jgi:hypothetical protein
MIDASVNITRRTMLRAVGAKQLHRCYFFKWSAIEHIFTQGVKP